uniref:Uncharacterized protein n=1 Tax=Rhizophora mucronata TaxID=61149 RepID=A0A2P2NS16_RHIMU
MGLKIQIIVILGIFWHKGCQKNSPSNIFWLTVTSV